jgi:hypothetical protein
VTLLNNERLAAGKPPLGFLNSLMYQLAVQVPEAFNDVVVGFNRCGALETTPVCCAYGYEAAPGFDAVGGLGTPNFPVLRGTSAGCVGVGEAVAYQLSSRGACAALKKVGLFRWRSAEYMRFVGCLCTCIIQPQKNIHVSLLLVVRCRRRHRLRVLRRPVAVKHGLQLRHERRLLHGKPETARGQEVVAAPAATHSVRPWHTNQREWSDEVPVLRGDVGDVVRHHVLGVVDARERHRLLVRQVCSGVSVAK